MDEQSIFTFITTLVVSSIVTTAFETIDGLHKDFMDFINTHGVDNTASSQELLQDIFCDVLRDYLSRPKLFSHCCTKHGSSCTTYETCLLLDPVLWGVVLYEFKEKCLAKKNRLSIKLHWALENITDFRKKFDNFMANFAEVHKIKTCSILYTEHLANFKNILQEKMDNFCYHVLTHKHNTFCLEVACVAFEECGYCLNFLKNSWSNLLDDVSWAEQQFSTDFVLDSDHEPLISKDSCRCDFNKNSKNVLRDKERYRRNKGQLSRDKGQSSRKKGNHNKDFCRDFVVSSRTLSIPRISCESDKDFD